MIATAFSGWTPIVSEAEHLPHIRSNSTLRNHISAIIDAGYIRKVHQGAGPRNGPGRRRRGRAGFTQYFIDAPGITPDLPYQYRMPLLVLMTPADELPSLFEDWDRSRSEDWTEFARCAFCPRIGQVS